MPRHTKSAEEIVEAIRQALYQDPSLEWRLSDIPYFTTVGLPPGRPPGAPNWELSIGSCPPEVEAAIQLAKVALQQEVDLAQPPLGSSLTG